MQELDQLKRAMRELEKETQDLQREVRELQKELARYKPTTQTLYIKE